MSDPEAVLPQEVDGYEGFRRQPGARRTAYQAKTMAALVKPPMALECNIFFRARVVFSRFFIAESE
jgi:hypothetical protein